MKANYFITGTDTDVGKTIVTKSLLQAFAAKGVSAVGYKPVAAGSELTEQGWQNADALCLQQASTIKIDYENINPYPLILPASPHIAAKQEQVDIDFSVLSQRLFQLRQQSEVVLVEGAGGWRVPVSEQCFLSDWVKLEALPVILVVGIQLGCLNHAQLTTEAILADGLEIAGWVANRINPGVDHYQQHIEQLTRHIPAPKLGEIPYCTNVRGRNLAQYLHIERLIEAELVG